MTRRRFVVVVWFLIFVAPAGCGPSGEIPQPPAGRADAGAKETVTPSGGDADGAAAVSPPADGVTRADGGRASDAALTPDAARSADARASVPETMTMADAARADAGTGTDAGPGENVEAMEHGKAAAIADAGAGEVTKIVGAAGGDGGDGVEIIDAVASAPAADAAAASNDAVATSPVDVARPALAVLSVAPAAGATSVSVFANVVITFDAPIDPATVVAQPEPGPCGGSVQASTDGFATCLGFAAARPVTSVDGRVATITPAPAFSYGSTIEIRITTGAASSDGAALAAPVTSAGFTTALPGPSCDRSVVLSQIYGGGGNTNAVYSHDFVELHNRGEQAVDVTGWSIQYASATGASWSATVLPGAVIPGGGYFLIQEGSGGAVGAALPGPDASGTLNFGGASGKVALVASAAVLTGACPQGAQVADLVGYGAAGCFEGNAAADSPPAGGSIVRADSGCADSDQNALDLASGAASPRNGASSRSLCDCGAAPTMNETGLALEVDDCVVQSPTSLSVAAGGTTPPILGRLYEAGTSEADGAAAGVVAELGFGPIGVNPSTQPGWTWSAAAYDAQIADQDQYQASFTAPASPGRYGYAYRFSLDAGFSWTYCDANGAGSNPGLTFETTQLPLMVVTAR